MPNDPITVTREVDAPLSPVLDWPDRPHGWETPTVELDELASPVVRMRYGPTGAAVSWRPAMVGHEPGIACDVHHLPGHVLVDLFGRHGSSDLPTVRAYGETVTLRVLEDWSAVQAAALDAFRDVLLSRAVNR